MTQFKNHPTVGIWDENCLCTAALCSVFTHRLGEHQQQYLLQFSSTGVDQTRLVTTYLSVVAVSPFSPTKV